MINVNRRRPCVGAGHLEVWQRILENEKAVPTIGRGEEKTFYSVILLGSGSAVERLCFQNL